MKRLNAIEVHALKVAELGLDQTAIDLTSIEAITASLRRAASFLCPCAAATLVRNVVYPLRDLVDDLDAHKDLTEDILEAMIAHGDLLEHQNITDNQNLGVETLIYAAPPSFVLRNSGVIILLGIASGQSPALSDELKTRIEYVNHIRRITPFPNEDLSGELIQIGLLKLSYDNWLKQPPTISYTQHLANMNHLLDEVQPSRDIPGLVLLDPKSPVYYYRRRWIEPRSRIGRFVGRRRQAYGSDLWCYVQLCDGNPERLIDLPIAGSRWHGCDEAWHLQMAIDAQRGEPQRFRIRSGPGGTFLLELFSPVPMWGRRRWDAVGEPVSFSGSLFTYRFKAAEIEEELWFARNVLWLQKI